MTGRVRIRGSRESGAQLCGRDVGVFLVDSDGREVLLPVRKLELQIAGRHDAVLARMEVDVDELNLDGMAIGALRSGAVGEDGDVPIVQPVTDGEGEG